MKIACTGHYKALTGDEQNHSSIRLHIQRFENLNRDSFKEILTEVNKPTIDEHVRYVEYLEHGELMWKYLLSPTILEYQVLPAQSAATVTRPL